MSAKIHTYKRVPLDQLMPAAANPRTHSKQQIDQLRRSIREFGFTNPLLVDESGTLIAGHGRLAAAALEGMVDVPTIEVAGLNVEQKRALVIADNQLALNAGWDADILRAELESLESSDFDVSIVGFDDAELSKILAGDAVPLDVLDEWNGMPEFEQKNTQAFRSLIVHFADQAAVDAFTELTKLPISESTRYAWYPEHKRTVRDHEYVSRED